MTFQCDICSKKPVMGNSLTQRGKAKYLGGNGRKTTGIARRAFKPNLQSVVTHTPQGPKRMRVCTKCLRSGLVTKKIVRLPFTLPTK